MQRLLTGQALGSVLSRRAVRRLVIKGSQGSEARSGASRVPAPQFREGRAGPGGPRAAAAHGAAARREKSAAGLGRPGAGAPNPTPAVACCDRRAGDGVRPGSSASSDPFPSPPRVTDRSHAPVREPVPCREGRAPPPAHFGGCFSSRGLKG